MNYDLKKYFWNKATAQHDANILRYMQLAATTSQQYGDDLLEKKCKIAEVYDNKRLNKVFIKRAKILLAIVCVTTEQQMHKRT